MAGEPLLGGESPRLPPTQRRCPLPCVPHPSYPTYDFCTEEQDALLDPVRARVGIPFSLEDKEHVKILEALWAAFRPKESFPGTKCKSWQSLGFQSETPTTDFRGGGLLACEQLVALAEREPEFVRGVCGPDLDYPFAAGCINITHMLCGFLGLLEAPTHMYGGVIEPRKDCTLVAFVRLLLADRNAFDTIYGHCVHSMHRAWREMHVEEPATTLLDFPRAVIAAWEHIHTCLQEQPASPLELQDLVRTTDLVIRAQPIFHLSRSGGGACSCCESRCCACSCCYSS